MAINISNLGVSSTQKDYSNLNTITKQADALGNRYDSLYGKYEKKSKTANWIQTGTSIAGSVVGAAISLFTGNWQDLLTKLGTGAPTGLGSLAGTLISGVGSLISSSVQEKANNYLTQAEKTYYAQQNITNYGELLSSRDKLLSQGMDVINNSLTEISNAYGSEFVNNLYNYYLSQYGLSDGAYSMLTGNFNTFDTTGYGTVAGMERVGEFNLSSLTSGDNLFLNNYTNLTTDNLGDFKYLLVNNLVGSDTEAGIALRTIQQELQDMLSQYDLETNRLIEKGSEELDALAETSRESNISGQEALGSAEAERATSGLRGATAFANENLQKLQNAMTEINNSAKANSIIATLKYEIQKYRSNASSQAYQYQQNIKKLEQKNITDSMNALNNLVNSVSQAEESANESIQEASKYAESLKKYSEETDEDRIWELVN